MGLERIPGVHKLTGKMVVEFFSDGDVVVSFPMAQGIGIGRLEQLIPLFARELGRAHAKLRSERSELEEEDGRGPEAA